MIIDAITVIVVIVLGLGAIVLIASALQKWMVERGLYQKLIHPILKKPKLRYPELSEKLRAHLGMELPVYDVYAALSMPYTDDVLVMLDYSHSFANILRCHSDGSLVWQAQLPGKAGDVYIKMEWKDRELIAGSWFGYSVNLDIETGRILRSEFIK